MVTVEQVIDQLSASGSTWTRADVLRAICDLQPAAVPDVGTSLGGRPRTGLRPGDRPLRRPRPRRRDSPPPGVGWPFDLAGADRPALHQRHDPRRGGTSAGLGDGRPSRRAGAVDHHRPGRARRARRPTPPRRSPVPTVWSSSSARPAPARPPRCERAVDDLAAWDRPVFGVAPTAKAARVLERETGMDSRHRRQAAPRMEPRRPATARPLPAPRRHDADRR